MRGAAVLVAAVVAVGVYLLHYDGKRMSAPALQHLLYTDSLRWAPIIRCA